MKRIERKDIYKLFVLGALNIPINQFLFMTSVHYTTAPNVAFAYGLVPVFVLVIAVIFLKEKLSLKKKQQVLCWHYQALLYCSSTKGRTFHLILF